MSPLFVRSTVVFAVVLMASSTMPAFGQSSPGQSSPDLKARCSQLMTFFDWYGASRSENTDGARNHTRLGAEMECKKGNYRQGVALMYRLCLRRWPKCPWGAPLAPPWRLSRGEAARWHGFCSVYVRLGLTADVVLLLENCPPRYPRGGHFFEEGPAAARAKRSARRLPVRRFADRPS